MWNTRLGPWAGASRTVKTTPVGRSRPPQTGTTAPSFFALNRVTTNHLLGFSLSASFARFFHTLPSSIGKTDALLRSFQYRILSPENPVRQSPTAQSASLQRRTLQGSSFRSQAPPATLDPKRTPRPHQQEATSKPKTSFSMLLLALGCALASGTLSYHGEAIKQLCSSSQLYANLKRHWNAPEHNRVRTERPQDKAARTDGPGPRADNRLRDEPPLQETNGDPRIDDLIDGEETGASEVDLDGFEERKPGSEGYDACTSTSQSESNSSATAHPMTVNTEQDRHFAIKKAAEPLERDALLDAPDAAQTTVGVSVIQHGAAAADNSVRDAPPANDTSMADTTVTDNRPEAEADDASLREGIFVPPNTEAVAPIGLKMETAPANDENEAAEVVDRETRHMQPADNAEKPQELSKTRVHKSIDTHVTRCASASELLEFVKSIVEENLGWRLQEAHREWSERLDAIKREAREEGFQQGRENGLQKAATLQQLLDGQLEQTVERMRRMCELLQDTQRMVKHQKQKVASAVEKTQRLRVLVLLHQRLMLGLPLGSLLERCQEWKNMAEDTPDFFVRGILDSIPQRFQEKLFTKPTLSQGHLQQMLEGLSADAFQACFIGESVGLLAHARALLQRAIFNATGWVVPVAVWERFKEGVFSQAATFGFIEGSPRDYATLKRKALEATQTSENVQLVQQALICSRNGQFYEAYSLLKTAPPLLHGIVRCWLEETEYFLTVHAAVSTLYGHVLLEEV